MHEFGIGEELVKAVLTEMERLTPPRRLLRVRVTVGALLRVSPESLRFAYETLTRDTAAAGSVLEIVPVPVTVLCRDCGWRGQIDDLAFRCRGCGAANLDTLQGSALSIDQLELEEHDAT